MDPRTRRTDYEPFKPSQSAGGDGVRVQHSNVVLYELFELYDWGKVPELYNGHGTLWNFTNFTFLGCSLFSAGPCVVVV